MCYLSINVYEDPTGFAFDLEDVLRRLKELFTETHVDPGDQLEIRARAAEERFVDPTPAMRKVIEQMWRDARQQGPAYSFEIPCRTTGSVKGVVKRHLVQIGFEGEVDNDLLERVESFLPSLVPSSVSAEIERD